MDQNDRFELMWQSSLHAGKSSSKKPKDLTFIGIHIRKTDADRNYVRMYNLPALNPSYYLQAIDLYRQNFKHTGILRVNRIYSWSIKIVFFFSVCGLQRRYGLGEDEAFAEGRIRCSLPTWRRTVTSNKHYFSPI